MATMRPTIVAIALALTACSPAPLEPLCVPGESRECACSSGATGAQVCDDTGEHFMPCACDGADGGVEDASVADASSAVDASPGDAGGLIDAGRDSGSPVDAARPDAPTWACSVVPQSGCAPGYACRLSHVGGRTPGNGPPECVDAGFRGERDISCTRWSGVPDSPPDDCAEGLFCWIVCRRYCLPSGDPCPSVGGSPFRCETGPDSLIEGNPLGLGTCVIDL